MNQLDLKKILSDSGLTQAELARRLDMPPSNLKRMLENDDIKLSNVYKISVALGISVGELLGITAHEGCVENSNSDVIISRLQDIIEGQQRIIDKLTDTIKAISIKQ